MRVCSDRRLREENVPERAGPVRPPVRHRNSTKQLFYRSESHLSWRGRNFSLGAKKRRRRRLGFPIVSDGSQQRTGLKEKSTRGKTFPSRKRPQLSTLYFECDSVQKRQKKNLKNMQIYFCLFRKEFPDRATTCLNCTIRKKLLIHFYNIKDMDQIFPHLRTVMFK
jgi:hypothetical protein